jgi:hypothetical protein
VPHCDTSKYFGQAFQGVFAAKNLFDLLKALRLAKKVVS